jgi:Uma2 family endonuclease
MATSTSLVKADELLGMPRDGFRYELIQGELRKMSPSGNEHGRIAANITRSLGQHVVDSDLGAVYAAETGFLIATNPDTVRALDVAFVSQERLDRVGPVQGYWPGAPDLVVEVISASDTYTEVEEKVMDWLQAGAHMVVVVNPRKRVVKVHRSPNDVVTLTEGENLDGGEVVSGWSMAIKEVFR